MTTLSLGPSGYDAARFFDIPESRFRLDRKTLIASGVVLAAFAGLGLYFASQKFVIDLTPRNDSGVIVLDQWLPKPPPPPEPRELVTETPRVNEPLVAPRPVENPVVTEVEPIPYTPQPTPAEPAIGPVEIATAKIPEVRPIEPVVRRARVVTQPDWLRQPSSDDIAELYPDRALRLEKQGMAILSCTVTDTGSLSGCSVSAETPVGEGFGRAALRMVPMFRMRPQTEDGAAVGGARVNVPVNFRLR